MSLFDWRGLWARLTEPAPGVADSLLAHGTEFKGSLRFHGVLVLEGLVRGSVLGGPGAMLIVTEHGRIVGDVQSPYVQIRGQIDGNVEGESHVHLASSARISGSVYYRELEREPGAVVGGALVLRELRIGAAKWGKASGEGNS